VTNDSHSATDVRPPGTTAGFWALIVTQFQGAFSDNVVKNLVVFVALFGTGLTLKEQNSYSEWITALFALPFILFSMAGGFLADRFSKRSVMLGVKIFELGIMSLVLTGLWLWNKNLLLASVFLMGTHSAFFGPSKYGSLPELLPERKLSWGNGILELGTFMAIILGTVAASVMSQQFHGCQWISGGILVALAVIGFFSCLGITRIPAANPAKKFDPNFPAEIWRQLRAMRGDRPLWLALAGNTYFNFLGMLLLLNLFFFGADTLRVDELHIGGLAVALALGIGLGSAAAGWLSGGKIEYGLVPLGAFGLSVCAVLLALPSVAYAGSLVLLALLGFAGGFFIVPIAALLQHRPARENKGQVQATANWLAFVGVFLASGAHWLLAQQLQFSPRVIFFIGGGMTLAGAAYAVSLLPDSLLRFLLWGLTHLCYRIRVVGRDRIPEKGGALFVCNHVSYADALLLIAATDRPIRFLMFKDIYEKTWVKPFAKILGTIPVSAEQRPRELLRALQTASDAIRNGEVVCLFAEGQITRIGQLLPFRRGMEHIMKNVAAPIVPVALYGVIGGPLSFRHGRLVHLLTAHYPHPVTVSFGEPLPPEATPIAVRDAVQELQVEAWKFRRARMQWLPRHFVRMAREHPHRFAMADVQTPKITFGTALVKTIFLARRLKRVWRGQRMVGIFIPPSVPGALVNYAAFLCGRVPVNLNYTFTGATIADCVQQCEIKTIITSRKFLEKIKITPPGELVFLEDLAAAPGWTEKFNALLLAKFMPLFWLQRVLSPDRKSMARSKNLDALATVIFSSGSTGEPKGVMLSQFNLMANIEQCGEIIDIDETKRLLGILPFFHSFGFTVTLCLPLVLGAGVVFYPNPLDSRGVGAMVRKYKVNIMLGTTTFLQIYMRGVTPEDFGSLQLVVTGAEKLPERLALAFEARFGVRPYEGYGCTECAPVVVLNTWDYRAAGFYQVGGKLGKIGRPMPGICVRIAESTNPWSGKILPPGESGMLLVHGPNVMLGYLHQPEKTAKVLHNGWYCTGDIARMDEDGFLEITGRLNRFSKLGGEMVPHLKIEEKLQEIADVPEIAFVVVGVPDEKRGERLVVLHRLDDEKLADVLKKFAECDLPNLWKPKADAFYRVEHFPLLGTGKLDLRQVKEIAAARSAGNG
jgi:acyl-[acyl-carrier-protein]-phospholipid O-acyltransferase/long-chain-fatty-acid--[acyl-carrier-protein] ligase